MVFFARNLETDFNMVRYDNKNDELRWFPADLYNNQKAKKDAARAEILAHPRVQAAIKLGIKPVVR